MMIRLVLALYLALCGVANAQLAGGLQFPGPGTAHTAGVAAPTIDGSNTNSGGTTTQTVSITNSLTSDIIVVFLVVNSTTVSSVSGSVRGSYTFRNSINNGTSAVYEYWVQAPTATTETVTITYAGTATFSIATAFGVHGLNNPASPFDSNGSLPASANAISGATLATSGSNDMVISAAVTTSSVDGGWTDINNQAFWVVRYATFSSPQGTFFVPYSGGGGPVLSDALLGP